MGIRFRCPACGKKIHVKDFLAGKRGICPRCEAGVEIPLASQLPPSRKKKGAGRTLAGTRHEAPDEAGELVEASSGIPLGRLLGASEFPSADPLLQSAGHRWYAFAPDGREVGPLSAADVRAMIDVGYIRAESSVRRDDWPARMIAAAVWPDWKGADPFAASHPLDRSAEAELSPAAHSAPPPIPKVPAGLPPADTRPADQPAAVDSPTLYLPPSVGRSLNSAAPRHAHPHAVPPAATNAAGPPYSVPPADSAVPEPGLYYSRGSNVSYVVALVLLTLVVAVLAAAAYRVIVDPPAWLRPPQSGHAPQRSLLASEPFFPRNHR